MEASVKAKEVQEQLAQEAEEAARLREKPQRAGGTLIPIACLIHAWVLMRWTHRGAKMPARLSMQGRARMGMPRRAHRRTPVR